jgi:DNA polymerase III alpha subunit
MSIKTDVNSVPDLIEGILTHGPSILKNCVVNHSDIVTQYIERCISEKLDYNLPHLEKFGNTEWLLPEQYQHIDIESWLLGQCTTDEEKNRVRDEIVLYNRNNMITVLKTMKYVVDILRQNEIVWGVGRGSSVASYCLFLIGIHKINSIKYKLPIEEFFKGEENG